jgi:hypothetical protein
MNPETFLLEMMGGIIESEFYKIAYNTFATFHYLMWKICDGTIIF